MAIECDSQELLPILQWIFDADFPEDIRDVKTAKTRDHDGAILFIVKLAGEPNTIGRFLESFENKLAPVDYNSESDNRGSLWPFTPRWFKKPIKQGTISWVSSVRGTTTTGFRAYVYIDTTNEKNFIVYFYGNYSTSLEKKIQNQQ